MMRFFYGSGSPYSWRVQLVLEEKGLPYEPVLLSFQKGEHKTAEHLARHPHGKVPALADGDLVLYESTPIVEYLEDRYPRPALLPDDAPRRATVRMEEAEAVLYFGDAFRNVARQVFFTPPERRDDVVIAEARTAVRHELARLETRAAARGGPYVTGADFTRADLSWVPFVEIAARGGVDLDAAATPWLHHWRERMRARPAYARSYPPHWRAGG
jgi:glutathione S-transferase